MRRKPRLYGLADASGILDAAQAELSLLVVECKAFWPTMKKCLQSSCAGVTGERLQHRLRSARYPEVPWREVPVCATS